MKKTIHFLLILLALSRSMLLSEPFFSINITDKEAHISLGAISAFSCLAIDSMMAPDEAQNQIRKMSIALGAAMVAGSIKEIMDLCGHGTPDWMDLAATASGGAIAGLGSCLIDNFQKQPDAWYPIQYSSLAVIHSIPVLVYLMK